MKVRARRTSRDPLPEAAGYVCTRAGGSLGLLDVIATGPADMRLSLVKAGTKHLSQVEREQITELATPELHA
jgi:hypothetical protein